MDALPEMTLAFPSEKRCRFNDSIIAKAALPVPELRRGVAHHVGREDEVHVGAKPQTVQHRVRNRDRIDAGLHLDEDRGEALVDLVGALGRSDAADLPGRIHRHEDRAVEAHAGGFKPAHDLEGLVEEREFVSDLSEDVVAHDHFVPGERTLDRAAKPRLHHEVGRLVDPDQLHLHRAALRIERRNEELPRRALHGRDRFDHVEERALQIKGRGFGAEDHAFDLFALPLRDDQKVRAHAGGERPDPLLQVRRDHRPDEQHEGEDRHHERERDRAPGLFGEVRRGEPPRGECLHDPVTRGARAAKGPRRR